MVLQRHLPCGPVDEAEDAGHVGVDARNSVFAAPYAPTDDTSLHVLRAVAVVLAVGTHQRSTAVTGASVNVGLAAGAQGSGIEVEVLSKSGRSQALLTLVRRNHVQLHLLQDDLIFAGLV